MSMVQLSIWNGEGTQVLQVENGFLQVDVIGGVNAPPWQITKSVAEQLGLYVAPLRTVSWDRVEVECLNSESVLRTRHRWRDEELTPGLDDREEWQRPGWLSRALELIDSELRKLELVRVGPPEPMRHTNLAMVLRIPTNRRAVWFKMLPGLFGLESRVIEWLVGIAPLAVPNVAAAGESWWISTEFTTVCDEAVGDPLQGLARIQQESAPFIDELASLGVPVRRLDTVPDAVARVSECLDLLGAERAEAVKSALPQLRKLSDRLDSLCSATLVHGDLHADNVRWTKHGWFLYDWTDACVAHPFVDLSMALLFDTDAEAKARTARYAAAWRGIMSAEQTACAVDAAPVIGAAHQLVSYHRIIEGTKRAGIDHYVFTLRGWAERLVAALLKD